jgi:hypothetical protein
MFCTYLTIYSGNKLPPFYVGSTSVAKINSGYRGSVSSIEYKSIWKSELKDNPKLFRTIILSKHDTRREALDKENKLHKLIGVSNNALYINKANAIPDGKFGVNTAGINNPMYGKKRPDASKLMLECNPMFNKEISEKVRQTKLLLHSSGKHASTRNSDTTLEKASIRMKENNPNSIRCCCIVCKTVTTPSAIIRFHNHERKTNEKVSSI